MATEHKIESQAFTVTRHSLRAGERERQEKIFERNAASMARFGTDVRGFYAAMASLTEMAPGVEFDSGVAKVKDATGSIVWSGHFLATWRKKDGKWQTVRDIWTNDLLESSK